MPTPLLTLQKKFNVMSKWPARLDADLRAMFGDAIHPKTTFDAALQDYTTEFQTPSDPILELEIKAYIKGFRSAIELVMAA